MFIKDEQGEIRYILMRPNLIEMILQLLNTIYKQFSNQDYTGLFDIVCSRIKTELNFRFPINK